MKGFLGFAVGIILLVVAGIYLANQDPIGKEVTHANAELAVGSTVLNDVQQGFNVIMKWMFGATLAGMGVAAFNEARKVYRMWFLDHKQRRWRSGPNARWQQQQPPAQRAPNLSKADVMLMALMNGQQRLQGLRTRLNPRRQQSNGIDPDELNIDL